MGLKGEPEPPLASILWLAAQAHTSLSEKGRKWRDLEHNRDFFQEMFSQLGRGKGCLSYCFDTNIKPQTFSSQWDSQKQSSSREPGFL